MTARRPGTLLAVGETMAMIVPRIFASVVDAPSFLVEAGGAESNVATHVADAGHRAVWFSRLGDDALGRRVARQLASRGVDVTTVQWDAGRPTGLYVKNPGGGVSYYRRGSAASALAPSDATGIDLDGVDVLHVSGITAAISDSARRFLEDLMARARGAGVRVSFDVNHRAALWDATTAAAVILALARKADIVFTGRDEAETLWGTANADDVRALLPDVAELIVKDGDVGATAFTGEGGVFVPALAVDVIEPVGAGDAFAGGYLAASLSGASTQERLSAGHARAVRTLTSLTDTVEGIDA
nr:sugar kinase [Microbacterium testaceum]